MSDVGHQGPSGGSGSDRAARWYRALVQNSSDMVLVVGADGSAIYASPSTERLLGYKAQDWADRDIWEVVHPEDRSLVEDAYLELVRHARSSVPVSFRLRCADGTFRHVEAVGSNQLDDDAVGGVVINLRDISERVRAEQQARLADQRYRTLVGSLVYGVMLVDAEGRLEVMNETLEKMVGAPSDLLLGRLVAEFLGDAVVAGTQVVDGSGNPLAVEEHPLMKALRTGEPTSGEIGVMRPGEPVIWMRVNAQAIFADAGSPPVGAAASFADTTASRQAALDLEEALSALRRERTFLRVLLDNLEEGIVTCDAEGRLTLLNPASRRFHGISEGDDPLGRVPSAAGLRHPDGTLMTGDENPLLRALAGEQVKNDELIVENRNGERRVVVANAQALYDDDGQKLGAVVAMHDVSDMKRNEERLAELALHDPLTGVANRLLLDDRLQLSLERMRRGGGGVGVFLLDLDDFKAVNDLHGHEVGDDVLTAVARRLRGALRPDDTVARLGGDEFVVLCQVSGGTREVEQISARLSAALAEPYLLDGRTLTVEASVGGVLINDPNADAGRLLGMADDEMYRAKARRRSARHRPGGVSNGSHLVSGPEGPTPSH